MALFDSIVSDAEEKFDLNGKGRKLLATLLAVIGDQNNGSFAGFMRHFDKVGLGDTASSWISSNANTPLSYEQAESAFGTKTLKEFAGQTGLDYKTATEATAFMTPHIIDELTPAGVAPDNADLAATIAGVTGVGAAAGNVKAADFGRSREISATRADDTAIIEDGNSGSPLLKILLPLLLLGLAIALGFVFCGKSEPVNTVNQRVNANANIVNNNFNIQKPAESSAPTIEPGFSIKAENGKYLVSGIVGDEATKKQIMEVMSAQFGADNVDFTNLKVDANAKNFAAGWWENVGKLLPDLKNWKTGELNFNGNTISASNLPQNAVNTLKTLFASGWKLPVSLIGEESAAEQANEDAAAKLSEAKNPEQIVAALNLSIINFASNSAEIPKSADPVLDKAAEVLNRQPASTLVEIGGHTDSDGNDQANLKLSQERADAVRRALIERGIDERLLTTKGYGETQPIAPNDTPDNKFRNRRIEYKLITDKEIIKETKFGSNSGATN